MALTPRRRATDGVYALAAAAGVPRLYRAVSGKGVVFSLHNVTAQKGERDGADWSLHLPVAEFRDYLEWMAGAFRIVPLGELLARAAAGQSLRGLASLTFDDAYQGVFAQALPLLRARGLPASVFVVSDASTAPAPFWWDRVAEHGGLTPANRDALLTTWAGDGVRIAEHLKLPAWSAPAEFLPAPWQRLREVAGPDITWGAHTRSHRNLLTLDDDAVKDELSASRRRIAEELGTEPTQFAYPYGLVDERVARLAAAAGFTTAVSLSYGLVGPGSSAWALPRINVGAGIGVPKLDCWAGGLRWPGSR